jgi:hypothetical protein
MITIDEPTMPWVGAKLETEGTAALAGEAKGISQPTAATRERKSRTILRRIGPLPFVTVWIDAIDPSAPGARGKAVLALTCRSRSHVSKSWIDSPASSDRYSRTLTPIVSGQT